MNQEVFIRGYGVEVLCQECAKLIGDLHMFTPEVFENTSRPCARCQTHNEPVFGEPPPWETWNEFAHAEMVRECELRAKQNYRF